MAKITRNSLKGIVKECLVELLAEGLGSPEVILESRPRNSKPSRKKTRSIFDQMDQAFSKDQPKKDFNERVNNVAKLATRNPVLQDILADTARTTLQEQIGEESKVTSHSRQVSINGDQAAKAASTADPLDLFGESASNWASLAFSESKQTK